MKGFPHSRDQNRVSVVLFVLDFLSLYLSCTTHRQKKLIILLKYSLPPQAFNQASRGMASDGTEIANKRSGKVKEGQMHHLTVLRSTKIHSKMKGKIYNN